MVRWGRGWVAAVVAAGAVACAGPAGLRHRVVRGESLYRISQAYGDPEQWARMSILNAARSGRFSSDRTIREYCSDIWKVSPVPIRLLSQDEVKAGFLQ